jgi:hypothetical protein
MLAKSWPRLEIRTQLASWLWHTGWHALNVAKPVQINFSRHMPQCLQGRRWHVKKVSHSLFALLKLADIRFVTREKYYYFHRK